MAFPLFRYNSQPDDPQQPPLSIIVMPRDVGREGAWRPDAFVAMTKTLRTSGFLMALPPEDLKSLLVMLSFLSPNGHCTVMVQQLASAFGLSSHKTRARMNRLVDFRWLDQPIISYHRSESGVETYALILGFLPVKEEQIQPPPRPVLIGAGREAVIEHSRRTYARTRAEVEAEIAELNGWTKSSDDAPVEPVDPRKAAIHQKLLAVGMLSQQADELLERYDLSRIERQLMWLPLREVRSPVGFLFSAIKGDYEAPPGWTATKAEPPEASSDAP